MRHLRIAAVAAALCSVAAASEPGETTAAGGRTAPGADPVNKSDPAPAPVPGDPNAANPAPDPDVAGVGGTKGKDPNPPSSKKTANKAKETDKAAKAGNVVVIWCQPGHESYGIGEALSMPAKDAENLRAAGRVRYASDAEAAAVGGNLREVPGA